MARRRSAESRIFFPWEQRGSLVRRLGLRRVRPVVVGALLLAAIVVVGLRERRGAGVRKTRATIAAVSGALNEYLAENDQRCPQRFSDLRKHWSGPELPLDAWGRPLRLTCPSPRGDMPFLLSSDGPDRLAGGLDRIE
jgi:general secretion pathway protein G